MTLGNNDRNIVLKRMLIIHTPKKQISTASFTARPTPSAPPDDLIPL